MTTSSHPGGLKDNHDIRENPAEFMAAYARASKAFAGIPGVLGVGYGHVSKGGEYRVALGFQVFVHEKRAEAEVPVSERIPKTFEGFRVDVRAAEVMKPLESNPEYFNGKGYDARVSPIVGGIQIEPRQKALPPTGECKAAGTLGCIVKRRHKGGGDDNLYLLTNRHVLEGPDAAPCKPGDYVYQPYASKSTDPKPGLMLGTIVSMPDKKEYEHTNALGTFTTYLDCGIASIDVGSTCCGSVCGEGRLEFAPTIKGLGPAGETFEDWITDVRDVCGDTTLFVNVPRNTTDGQISQTQDLALGNALVMANATATKVRKMGRSSGRTVGLIVSANAWGYQDVFGNLTIIHGFLEIMIDPYFNDGQGNGRNRNGGRSFADNGDSGSIVVDDMNHAIGIVFGGPPTSQRQLSQWGVTWASHILPVLKELDVYIPTKDEAGTHDGSDGAWASLALPRSTPRGDPATTLFTSSGRSAAIEPTPETDLAGLGDRLRSSEAGARLFAVLQQHQRELSHLVRFSRTVKVIWHRHEGPAFLAQILGHLRGHAPAMPVEIRGVRRRVLLMRLRAALMSQGSYELQRALDEHGDLLLALSEAITFDECLEILGHPRPVVVDA